MASRSKIIDWAYLSTLSLYLFSSMISASKVIIYALVMLLFIFAIHYLKRKDVLCHQYFKWTTRFIIFSCFSLFWTISVYLSIWGIANAVIAIIPGISLYLFVNQKGQIHDVIIMFIVTTLFFALYAISYFGLSSMGEGRFGDDVEVGLNSNTLAICLLYSIIGGVILSLRPTVIKLYKLILWVICIVFLYVMLMTGCRKTLLMLFAIPVIYLFFKSKYKIITLSIIALLVSVGVYFLFSIPILYDTIGVRLLEMVGMILEGGDAEGDVTRFFLYKYGFEWFLDKPLLGRGINTYRILSDATPEFWGFNWYAHSNFVELLVDIGIIGTVLYFIWYYTCIKKNLHILNNTNDKAQGNSSLFIVTLVLTFIIFELFAVTYYDWFSQVFIAYMFALTEFNLRSQNSLAYEKNS